MRRFNRAPSPLRLALKAVYTPIALLRNEDDVRDGLRLLKILQDKPSWSMCRITDTGMSTRSAAY